MFLRPALHWAPFPSECLDSIVLSWSIADIAKTLPFSWPRSAVTKLPNDAAVVAVINCRKVPDHKIEIKVQNDKFLLLPDNWPNS